MAPTSRFLVLSLAFVAHTDALVVGGAARLQHRRAATHMGIFDAFVNAFMEKEEFDDRSAKGACHLLIRRSFRLSALSFQRTVPTIFSPQPPALPHFSLGAVQAAHRMPPTVAAQHILLKGGDIDARTVAAEAIKTKIEAGETTFEAAAREFSECSSRAETPAGSLGTFGPGKLTLALALALTLRPGKLALAQALALTLGPGKLALTLTLTPHLKPP